MDLGKHLPLYQVHKPLLLESMDSEVLLQTIRMHGLRYGKTDSIHADFGTNFCGAKSNLEEKDSLDLEEMRKVTLRNRTLPKVTEGSLGARQCRERCQALQEGDQQEDHLLCLQLAETVGVCRVDSEQ